MKVKLQDVVRELNRRNIRFALAQLSPENKKLQQNLLNYHKELVAMDQALDKLFTKARNLQNVTSFNPKDRKDLELAINKVKSCKDSISDAYYEIHSAAGLIYNIANQRLYIEAQD